MRILCFGSLNIDHVYQVDHIARPGQTLPAHSYQVFAGGKGANQSAALALAGARVYHAGLVGPDGSWLVDKLHNLGVDMQYTGTSDTPTGHALIQVDRQGENSIVIYPGCNFELSQGSMDATLKKFTKGDMLLLQNEINDISHLIKQAKNRGLKVCFNPAPFTPSVLDYPLEQVDLFFVNESEGQGLTGHKSPVEDTLLMALAEQLPHAEVVLTLGPRGARYHAPQLDLQIPARQVQPVDTTAAGDTFIGYFLAALASASTIPQALHQATRAAALCVTRPGAMDSIPRRDELT